MLVSESTAEMFANCISEIMHNKVVAILPQVACVLGIIVIICQYIVIIARVHKSHDDGDYGSKSNNIGRRLCILLIGFFRTWIVYCLISVSPDILTTSSPVIQVSLGSIIAIGAMSWTYLAYRDFRAACLLRYPKRCLCSRKAKLLPTVKPTAPDSAQTAASQPDKIPALTAGDCYSVLAKGKV